MTLQEFEEKLRAGTTVPLSVLQWEGISGELPVVERHKTQLAGELLIVALREDLVAIESPSKEARVARLLGGQAEASAFVEKRMEEYERMWDGCGVKVDYFGHG